MNILIVDDEELNCLLINEMVLMYLRDIEILDSSKVDMAYDGEEALQKSKVNDYDIIFMDVMMQNMDGFEATRQIRLLDISNQPAIIMVTALNDTKNVQNGFFNGANYYITKPYETNILETLLNDIVAGAFYLTDKDTSLVETKLTAEEFMKNFIFEFTIDKLEVLNETSLISLNNYMINKDETYLRELSNDFLSYCKYIQETQEFSKIAFGLLDISEILKDIKDNFDNNLFVDFMFAILDDLQSWSENIFLKKIAIDIHYLDESLVSSIIQLRSLFKNDEDEIEDENIFFF